MDVILTLPVASREKLTASVSTDIPSSPRCNIKKHKAINFLNLYQDQGEDQTGIYTSGEATTDNKDSNIKLLNSEKIKSKRTKRAIASCKHRNKLGIQYKALQEELDLQQENSLKKLARKKILRESILFLKNHSLSDESHSIIGKKKNEYSQHPDKNCSQMIGQLKDILGIKTDKKNSDTQENTLLFCLQTIQSIKKGTPRPTPKKPADNPFSNSSENIKNDLKKITETFHLRLSALFNELEHKLNIPKKKGLKKVSKPEILIACIKFINSHSLQSKSNTGGHEVTDIVNKQPYSQKMKMLFLQLNNALGLPSDKTRSGEETLKACLTRINDFYGDKAETHLNNFLFTSSPASPEVNYSGAPPNQCKSFQSHDTQGIEGNSAKTSPMGITDAKLNRPALAEAASNALAEHYSGGAPNYSGRSETTQNPVVNSTGAPPQSSGSSVFFSEDVFLPISVLLPPEGSLLTSSLPSEPDSPEIDTCLSPLLDFNDLVIEGFDGSDALPIEGFMNILDNPISEQSLSSATNSTEPESDDSKSPQGLSPLSIPPLSIQKAAQLGDHPESTQFLPADNSASSSITKPPAKQEKRQLEEEIKIIREKLNHAKEENSKLKERINQTESLFEKKEAEMQSILSDKLTLTVKVDSLQRDNEILSQNLKRAIIDKQQKNQSDKHNSDDNHATDKSNPENITTEELKNILSNIVKEQKYEVQAIQTFMSKIEPQLGNSINSTRTSFETLDTTTRTLKDKLQSLPWNPENKTDIETMENNIDIIIEHHKKIENLHKNKDNLNRTILNTLKIKKKTLTDKSEFYKSVLDKTSNPPLKRKIIIHDSNSPEKKQKK